MNHLLSMPELVTVIPRDLGGNYCFRGIQNSGKSLGMFAFINRLVGDHGFGSGFGYHWQNVTANFHIWINKPVFQEFEGGPLKRGTPPKDAIIIEPGIEQPGYTYMNNDKIKKFIRKVYRTSHGAIRHQIIAIDEIDQCYSHKFSSSDNEAIEDLLTLWQDKKLENFLLYTKHIGYGCNILIRQATEVSIKPFYDRRHDTLYLNVIDGFDMQVKWLTFEHISRLYPFYDRWEYIF
jgi:hypothetical protein